LLLLPLHRGIRKIFEFPKNIIYTINDQPHLHIMDPAFKGAGVSEGFELWRIEDFKPVKMNEVST
jgi:hypothetical protein